MHSNKANSTPDSRIIPTESLIDPMECIPVDIIIGLLNLAICLIRGILSASPEPILKAGISISCKKSAALLENGVDM